MTWRATALGLSLILSTACGETETSADSYTETPADSAAPPTSAIRFTTFDDASTPAFRHVTGATGDKWMPETMGGGVAIFDYDGDGWLDLLFTSGTAWPGQGSRGSGLALFRNNDGQGFEDITAQAGLNLPMYAMGLAVADYDADGDDDVYVTAVGSNRLLRNDRGRYTDVTLPMSVHGNDPSGLSPPAWSTGAAWVDTDRDGWLDLFVCNYVRWTPETDLFTTLDGTSKSYATPQQYDGETCRLYRNRAAQRFDDVTSISGVENPEGKSLGVAVEDLNDDGWPDLVVANDTYRNFLYLNDGTGNFTDVALTAGIALDEFGRARAGMGIDIGDVMGDGRLSIVIGNFSREALSLYTTVGPMAFQDLAGRARLNRPTTLPLTFGVAYVDLDLDGDQDIVAANGHIEPEINAVQQDVTFAQRPQVFQNDGNGRFTEVDVAELTDPVVGRGVAVGDLDNDGDLDVVITVNNGAPVMWANEAAGNAVQLRLRGTAPNVDAIGAVVHGFKGAQRQRWMVRTGSSYLSQSDYRHIVLGLGNDAAFDSVTVRWPTTGDVDNLGPLAAGQYIVEEETGVVR